MSINPIITTENLKKEYKRYLTSILSLKDDELQKAASKAIDIEEDNLVKGPYLESTPGYQAGKTISDLIEDGILEDEFRDLIPYIGDYPLYKHQEKAVIEAVKNENNILVSTGTGSGKTESFLIPILNYLIKEKNQFNRGPGVRVLLLYPMNALANDQLKRLRHILKDYPSITFGRYTGETKESEQDAIEDFKMTNRGEPILENELLSRETMKETPPDILVTNYAMLEYLLLRPADTVFFDGDMAKYWKYIVLDEAHIYTGSLGTEISYLLARLKDRVVGNGQGKIKFIATSATIINEDSNNEEVIKYMEDLTGESYNENSLIEAEKITYRVNDKLKKLSNLNLYGQMLDLVNEDNKEKLIELLENELSQVIEDTKSINQILYDFLLEDDSFNKLRLSIQEKTKSVNEFSKEIFGDDSKESLEALINLVELSNLAKKSSNDRSLLPAKYHVFTKSIEGVFTRFYPEVEIYLNRKEVELIEGQEVKVFEMANCTNCGQEYLIGKIKDDKLEQASGFNEDMDYFYLSNIDEASEYDEDSIDEESFKKEDTLEYILNCKTGELFLPHEMVEEFKTGLHRKIYKIENNSKGVSTCNSCMVTSPNGQRVKRIINADAPTTEVLARTLYQNIPADKQEEKSGQDNDIEAIFADFNSQESSLDNFEAGRKLLAFSDSRKDSAYFAAYMDIKYNQYLWKNIIYNSMKEDFEKNAIKSWSITDLANLIKGKKNSIVNQADDELIYSYLFFELLNYDPTYNLEEVGLITIDIESDVLKRILSLDQSFFDSKGLPDINSREFVDITKVIIHNLRKQRAVRFIKTSSHHPIFGRYDDEVSFLFSNTESREYIYHNNQRNLIINLMPSKKGHNNARSLYVENFYLKKGYSKDDAKDYANKYFILLESIVNSTHDALFERVNRQKKIFYKVNSDIIRFKLAENIYECNRCGSKSNIYNHGICPKYQCKGELKPWENISFKDNYYQELYKTIKKIPMEIKEHSAQIESKKAAEFQKKFEKGKINILSCSTTFELGVDVGSLEAVFLRNIPPNTANYVQRAGRAGRRTSSTAYILTYAKRRSHDMYYYQRPEEIIEGRIKTPYIEKDNKKIAFRHMNSIIFSWIFRKYLNDYNYNYFKNVKSLFAYDESDNINSIEKTLEKELNKKPDSIKTSFRNILTDDMYDEMGVDDWSWVYDRLLFQSEREGNSDLINAKNMWVKNIEDLTRLIEENLEKSFELRKIRETYFREQVISFLGSNNVLPKYGFPVDVVALDIVNTSKEANSVSLSRDLKIAISEFAPGNSVLANGKLWKSYSVNIANREGWPTYMYARCDHCGAIEMKPCSISTNLYEISDEDLKCKTGGCTGRLKYKKFIKPIFGFSTDTSEPKNPSLEKPETSYGSEVYFSSYDEDKKNIKEEFEIHGNLISYEYSPRGKLFIVNNNNGNSYRICKLCGYTENTLEKKKTIVKEHKDRYGNTCKNTNLELVDLGHDIITDVSIINLPNLIEDFGWDDYRSVLYAIVEGAVSYLGIARNEIDGVLTRNKNSSIPSFVLYDNVPGGAGHVKRIGTKLEEVLDSALHKVNGKCGCGPETSCYGCLRNYSNQRYHDLISRGQAYDYLAELLETIDDHHESLISKSDVLSLLNDRGIDYVENYKLLDSYGREFYVDILTENNEAIISEKNLIYRDELEEDGLVVKEIENYSLD